MTSSIRIGSVMSSVRWMWMALALVAGVLGMHALSPMGMPAAGRHDMAMSVVAPGRQPASAHAAGADCQHLTDPGGGMGTDHSGGTCAAGGTAAGYVPPVLMPSLVAREPAATAGSVPAVGAVDGRAPPDLSQLQLLRI
ncbi:DUF6153 family protein [Streptomyces cyanogenus]|uniref:DUF2946 domain-containing protein n=1 Tax=Streptomyces cyanogenus TaxID=80860 RepID=A0ABX7U1X0_STRCY|nr:DUF6153 family protein [Streptomyces cyanogenus]QTE03016.1 hypothetical protein S1361_37120 [Streptomyces cyanogenus]